jgi:predicted nucleotidyltransferase
MTTLTEIKDKLTILKPILQKKYPLESMAIFGSYARNEQTDASDVDVMVELNGEMGFNFIKMANEIEDYLGIKTDVLTKRSMKPKFYSRIENNLIYV